FEIQVDGKLVGELEREAWILLLKGRLLAQNAKEVFVELDSASRVRFRHVARLIIKENDFALKIGALLVQVDNLKPLLAFRVNVQAAVIILFQDFQDDGSATHFCQRILAGFDHAKGLLMLQALGDHLLIARLEDVQRQRRAGEQHHVQRKQSQEAHTTDSIAINTRLQVTGYRQQVIGNRPQVTGCRQTFLPARLVIQKRP